MHILSDNEHKRPFILPESLNDLSIPMIADWLTRLGKSTAWLIETLSLSEDQASLLLSNPEKLPSDTIKQIQDLLAQEYIAQTNASTQFVDEQLTAIIEKDHPKPPVWDDDEIPF